MSDELKQEETSKKGGKKSIIAGLGLGIGIAVIIVAVIMLIIFGGSIKDKIFGSSSSGAAKLRITLITSKNCGDNCFDINMVLNALRQNNIKEKINTIDLESRKAKKLVKKYEIKKVPTILVSGELDKTSDLQNFFEALGEIIDKVFVFRQGIPPYIDTATGELKGIVSVVYLSDKSCDKCYNVANHKGALTGLGIIPKDEKTVDISSDEGKALIEKYNIKKVPTILISGEVSEYQMLGQVWPQYGIITDDGTYIFTGMEVMGNYKDLDTGEMVEVKVPTPGQVAQ